MARLGALNFYRQKVTAQILQILAVRTFQAALLA